MGTATMTTPNPNIETKTPFLQRFANAYRAEADPFGANDFSALSQPRVSAPPSPAPLARTDLINPPIPPFYAQHVFSPFDPNQNAFVDRPIIPPPALIRRDSPTVAIPVKNQRKILQNLAKTFKEQGEDLQNPLRGFSHAYSNTIESHLNQLDQGRFDEPEIINHFAIDFAKRYQKNLDDLKNAAATGQPSTAEPHWRIAWEQGKEIDALPLPEGARKAAQILYGKDAHIDYDLKRSLTEALDYKSEHFANLDNSPATLGNDFATAGEHFNTTTIQTATEMGLPKALVTLGNFISDVPGHRLRRFQEWVKELF